MADRSSDPRDFAHLLETAPASVAERLVGASALTAAELASLADAFAEQGDIVDDLARMLIREWSRLTAAERTSALLLLAERLAQLNDAAI